jgi:hypothetical protein
MNVHEGLPERVRLLQQLHTYSRRPSSLITTDVNNVRGDHNWCRVTNLILRER